ncbi:Interactor of constitutive active ROPs 3-like protein [Drosera capensis]
MQNSKPRNSTSEVPPKVSPRATRPLKLNPPEFSTTSSGFGNRTPKDWCPKVHDSKSPRSPVCELLCVYAFDYLLRFVDDHQRKRPSRLSELESQISQLQDALKKVKDQLVDSESSKRGAQTNAEQAKKELLVVSSKLDESQKQLSELIASKEDHVLELRTISEEKDEAWKSQLEVIQKQHSVDSAALASALNEIQKLRLQIEMVAESDNAQTKSMHSTEAEIQNLREKLVETLTLVEITRSELACCQESESQAQQMAKDIMSQLQSAKDTVEALRLDAIKATEAYNCIASELDHSRAHANSLEDLVEKLKADLSQENDRYSSNAVDDQMIDSEHLNSELSHVQCEVARLRSALEAAEIRYQGEEAHNIMEIKRAQELVQQIKQTSSLREAELEEELKKAKADVEELRVTLLEKETELQGISGENEGLNMMLEKSALYLDKDHGLEKELLKLREDVSELKAQLISKETELQHTSEENEALKAEIKMQETDSATKNNVVGAEQEALLKLSQVMEEAERSKKKVARVSEQLDAVQAVNAEMESELRRLKVQSDQWRKAAEAAATMLSAGGNGKYVERTGSLDSNFSSPCLDEYDDDSPKKKNGNVLKKIGVLWKKPQK